ncbi:hypothetical protein [Clostridium sp. B9]|uniref:hypothetical protein n=1 Tax=Clostridium sp. B9 TaxID=3423224 RepID=UPI003D2EEA8C
MSKEYREEIEILNAYVKELSKIESKLVLTKEELDFKIALKENIKRREERLNKIA